MRPLKFCRRPMAKGMLYNLIFTNNSQKYMPLTHQTMYMHILFSIFYFFDIFVEIFKGQKYNRPIDILQYINMYSFSFFRELLELSEALQRDLVQSRTETLHYKQQIENRQYLQEHNEKNLQLLHKVKHSQSDLYNNQVPILAQNTSIGSVPSNVIPSNIINNDIRYSFFNPYLSDRSYLQ